MVKKVKSCVFISGDGTNLYSILKSSRNYSFPITIELIISNNINAKGLIYAKKYDIPFKIFNSSDQKVFEKKCLVELKKKKNKFLMFSWFYENFIQQFYQILWL